MRYANRNPSAQRLVVDWCGKLEDLELLEFSVSRVMPDYRNGQKLLLTYRWLLLTIYARQKLSAITKPNRYGPLSGVTINAKIRRGTCASIVYDSDLRPGREAVKRSTRAGGNGKSVCALLR